MVRHARSLYKCGNKMMMRAQATTRYSSILNHNRLAINTSYTTYGVTQRRPVSFLQRTLISANDEIRSDLDHAISMVQKFDPSGYLPGLLLTSNDAKIGYYAVRAFWIESGLRFKDLPLSNSIAATKQIRGHGQSGTLIPDAERIQNWKDGVESLYDNSTDLPKIPTMRLLKHVVDKHSLSKANFDRIILGREIDVDMKHYPTMKSLENHAEMSCVSLLNIVLECGGIYQDRGEGNNENDAFNMIIYDTARAVGIMHGLTNALRLSIPTASATGKVIVPQELCEKYDIKSPRYLLSALGMGDEECRRHLQSAVKDIVLIARRHLERARENKDELASHPNGPFAMSAFLPALASETFLNRLEKHGYDLTDRTLRNVGYVEHMQCAGSLLTSSFLKKF